MAVTKRYTLVVFQGPGQAKHQRTLTRACVANIQRQLDATIKTKPSQTEIEIWIDSPGGDAHATYKLLLDLRQRCNRLTAVIPDYAKSAATLLILGADQIWMTASADLGPLDVQIAHPDRETQPLSGLDIAGTFSYLSEFAMQLIITGAAAFKEASGLSRMEVLGVMQEFAAQFLRPCMEKIDPHVARRTVYQLKVAERYAESILDLRNVPEPFKLKPEAAKKLIKKLVHDYPVHEFCISRNEAMKLGLPVANAEKHPNWKVIKHVHEKFMDSESSVIKVLDDAQMQPTKKPATVAKKTTQKKKAGSINGNNANNTKATVKGANGKATATTRIAARFV